MGEGLKRARAAARATRMTAPVAAILPPGCELPGCKHHYQPGRNLAAEGCICPAWFDGGGWHLIEQNPECGGHVVTAANPAPAGEE